MFTLHLFIISFTVFFNKDSFMTRNQLAFGNRESSSFDRFNDYADYVSKEFRIEEIALAETSSGQFSGKVTVVSIGSIIGAAYVTSPLNFVDLDPDSIYIDIKLAGRLSSRTAGQTLEYGTNQAAFFPPGHAIYGNTTRHSSVVFKLSQDRLIETIRIMSPSRNFDASLLAKAQVLDTDSGPNVSQILRALFSVIEECQLSPELLGRLTMEDMIYRTTAFALAPFHFAREERRSVNRVSRSDKIVDNICELIRRNPSRWISKTEMEKIANLSGRAIQSAFQEKFGVPPMEWQRQEKLRSTREALLKSDDVTKIATLSYDFGFTSPAKFAAYYKRLFGELPSETLSQRNKRGR
jgi:AraC-like DNA-binding protein